MNIISRIYKPSLTLLTDLYQLTMAYGYWKSGIHDREAVFHLFFRKNPFKGGYAVAAGLEYAAGFLEDFGFSDHDLDYLETLTGNDGLPLFDSEFLDYLHRVEFECDVDAVPEGSVVFPHEPLLRIRGPLYQCQLIESALLNILNFQTLIATKASRICGAAQGDPVLEFGLRRAQGVDGSLAASRAAYIGGCAATSNVLAGCLFDIPVRGTHAHSWVMAYEDEEEAFREYAEAMPNNCIFLVDTYDTLEGVKKAVETGKWLRSQGHEMVGIRLDSGDLAQLSIEARKILDQGGFPKAVIVASNDLDDHVIADLKAQNAQIKVWGVGTRLSTAYDQAALGGVYKLGAIRDENGEWDFKLKLSEQPIKISNPGALQVRRFEKDGQYVADMLYNSESLISQEKLYDPMVAHQFRLVPEHDQWQDLLQPVFESGVLTAELPALKDIRARTFKELKKVAPAVRKLQDPSPYPLGLEENLHNLKTALIQKAKEA